ncbi:MAG TPA: ferritin-like protein [Allosphingosinicella sp.]
MIHLQRSMIAGLEGPSPDPQAVLAALQQAIELEHSTIPPYLYALYSLDETKNTEIAAIIQSVVIEEMLHMTLSSNVLNALGGSPAINQPNFIPTYPGPLPGGVEAQLTVHLAPFSMSGTPNQLQTFLTIEEPEDPLNFPTALVEADTITIGEFYTAISDAIAILGDGAFVGSPSNQVGPDLMWESVVVTDVATAQQAIQIIVEQGEGTTTSPLEVDGGGYAHYYRYMQIQKGHLLVPVANPGPNPDDAYAYTGDPVPFDPTGVYAVPVDPGGYAPGTQAAFLNDNFNYTYTSLLNALHDLFNGDANQDQMNRAIGVMMSLKGQAKAMMSGIPNPALLVGPSFQYQPVNPAVQSAA